MAQKWSSPHSLTKPEGPVSSWRHSAQVKKITNFWASPYEQSPQRLSSCVPICEWHEENETDLQYMRCSTLPASCNTTQTAKLPWQPTTVTCFASGSARMLRTQIFSYSISIKKLSQTSTNPQQKPYMFLVLAQGNQTKKIQNTCQDSAIFRHQGKWPTSCASSQEQTATLCGGTLLAKQQHSALLQWDSSCTFPCPLD